MEVYIVQAYRTAVGKSKRGALRFTRPDDLASQGPGNPVGNSKMKPYKAIQ